MPSTYKPYNQAEAPQYQPTAYQSTGRGNTQSRVQGAQPYSGLLGVNNRTAQNLGGLQAGYRESDAVTNARNYLTSLESNRPGDYQSRYTDQLDEIYNRIQSRGPFKYDLNGDALWQNYRDQYMQSGKQAMVDTIGQAATLTGGYGNSYAASVGNQAYQQWLRDMVGVIPDLYDRAAARYDQDTGDIYNQYALAQQADATDYGRWQDQLAQWNADRNWGTQNYGDEYARDYGQYGDMLNYWQNQAAQENAQYMTNRQYSYKLALQMLANGSMPTQDLLDQAGISLADAQSLLNPQVRTVVRTVNRPTEATGDLIDNPWAGVNNMGNVPASLESRVLQQQLNNAQGDLTWTTAFSPQQGVNASAARNAAAEVEDPKKKP